jgi:NitT/TauT family transport system substrate-binding protein
MAFKQARHRLIGGAAVAALSLAVSTAGATTALAADKLVFLTSWFAQAEHGGFYQALATGAYGKAVEVEP